jgi:aminomethyltransferase
MGFGIVIGPRVRKSPYFEATVAAGVSHFSIYNHMYMPVSYGDPEAEYRRLTEGVSLWDVAAERQVALEGPDAGALARYLTPRNLEGCKVGQGKYVPICDHDGILINDPVLLKLAEDRYWLSIADSDLLLWVKAIAAERGLDVRVSEPDASPLAVQGPKAEAVVAGLLGDWVRDLKYFWFRETELDGIPLVVARSGWSKQGGFELYLLDATRGGELWQRVEAAGRPYGIGPGGPNYVERVESALLSYGADNEPDCDPFEMGLARFVDLERADDFVGKARLIERKAAGPRRRLVGVFLDGPPLGSNQYPWPATLEGRPVGTIRVVAHSKRFGRNIGLALLRAEAAEPGPRLAIHGESGRLDGTVTALPFQPSEGASVAPLTMPGTAAAG